MQQWPRKRANRFLHGQFSRINDLPEKPRVILGPFTLAPICTNAVSGFNRDSVACSYSSRAWDGPAPRYRQLPASLSHTPGQPRRFARPSKSFNRVSQWCPEWRTPALLHVQKLCISSRPIAIRRISSLLACAYVAQWACPISRPLSDFSHSHERG